MKKFVAISVLLNFMLFGWVLALKRDHLCPLAVAKIDSAKVLPVRSTNFAPPQFHWSQIESTDYPTYVANLRAIGCPEQTIRDIIVADVGSLYASQRSQLKQSRTGDAETLKTTFEKARAEESAVIASLLGTRDEPNRFKPKACENSAISIPLVFQNVDLSRLKLGSDQIEIINRLRQRFVEQLGDPNSDSIAYRERWQKAQPDCDEMLRGFIGVNGYQDYQIAAMTSSDNFPLTP